MENSHRTSHNNRLPQQGGLNTRRIVISGVLGAIIILMGWTRLGFIPVPNITANATIMHVPVIIGGVLEGPIVGAVLGLVFGLVSFVQAADPIFKNPLIAIPPRLFIGVTAYFAYIIVKKSNTNLQSLFALVIGVLSGMFVHLLLKPVNPVLALAAGAVLGIAIFGCFVYLSRRLSTEILALVIAAVVGTFTNGILVLGMIWLYGHYPWAVLLPVLGTNTVAESIIAVILVVAIVTAWTRVGSGEAKAKM